MTTSTTDADASTAAESTETTAETEAVETGETETAAVGQDDGNEAADDAKPDNAIGREAARYRVRLREAEAATATLEAAHVETTDTLTRQRQAIVDAALTSAGLDPRLLAAAGHSVDAFVGDDGLVDAAKVAEATRAAVAEFGVQPRRGVRPNAQQGQPSGSDGGTTWGHLLGNVGRR